MAHGPDFFSITELLLAAMLAVNLLTLATVAWTVLPRGVPVRSALARRARRARAVATLRGLAIGDGLYVFLVLLTTLRHPGPIPAPRLGEPLCLAHRCITIDSATRTPPVAGSGSATYQLTLRLTNSSRYPMRDNVRGVYLVDDRGLRYPPLADPAERSLTAELGAFQAVDAKRTFLLPAETRGTGFVVDRGSGLGSGLRCLIIAGNCWFARPPEPPALIE